VPFTEPGLFVVGPEPGLVVPLVEPGLFVPIGCVPGWVVDVSVCCGWLSVGIVLSFIWACAQLKWRIYMQQYPILLPVGVVWVIVAQFA
jgi:hypothetical protein